jgi:hypothetical protein
MLFCSERQVIMSVCDTLCVFVPHPETFLCHAVGGHEVSGFHFHCKESLVEKARVLAVAVHLQMKFNAHVWLVNK